MMIMMMFIIILYISLYSVGEEKKEGLVLCERERVRIERGENDCD